MEKLDSIKSELQKISKIKNEILEDIKNLPENDKIDKKNKHYIIKFNDLNKDLNLSAKFYDYKHQYNLIVKELEKTEIINFENKINSIINDGKIRWFQTKYRSY